MTVSDSAVWLPVATKLFYSLILLLLCTVQILGHILYALASLFETFNTDPLTEGEGGGIKALPGNDAPPSERIMSKYNPNPHHFIVSLFHIFIYLACLYEQQH